MTEDLIFLALILVVLILFGLMIYIEYFWKARVGILVPIGKEDKTYLLKQVRAIYRNRDTIKVGRYSYVLVNPTYYYKNKPIYLFEEGNSSTLQFKGLNYVDALKTRLIVEDNFMAQLVKASNPITIDIKQFYPILIIVVIIIAILMFPSIYNAIFPHPTPVPTTPVPTITPVP